MILRKPYAFFIKYFKIIHLVIALLIAVLIYKTVKIVSFFTSYISDYLIAMNNFSVGSVINMYSFLLLLVIIIALIVVLSVMFVKKKPKLLYICNLALYVAGVIFFAITYSCLRDITGSILDIRVSKAIRDIGVLLIVLEAVSFILILVRATGFDIKKFDFGTDIQALEVNEKDSEEIEVAVEFDKNKARRNLRRNIRNAWYVYIEHKFVINLVLIIFLVIFAFMAYFSTSIYKANYKENKIFNASGISMNVTESYLVKNDYSGKAITGKNLVVVRFDVRKSYSSSKRLNTGLITLRIGNNSYGQTTLYNTKLGDLGIGYVDQKLTEDFEHYILAFAVDKNTIIDNAKLKINDNVSYVNGQMGAKSIYVDLKIKDADKVIKDYGIIKEKQIDFKDSILHNTLLKINKIELNNKFKTTYNFCASKKICYESYEYITPTATGNYLKSLMKIDGSLVVDNNISISGVTNLREFLNMFASIQYQSSGNSKTVKLNSETVKPQMSHNNDYYIEIPREAMSADQINLVFKIRGKTYIYKVK